MVTVAHEVLQGPLLIEVEVARSEIYQLVAMWLSGSGQQLPAAQVQYSYEFWRSHHGGPPFLAALVRWSLKCSIQLNTILHLQEQNSGLCTTSI